MGSVLHREDEALRVLGESARDGHGAGELLT